MEYPLNVFTSVYRDDVVQTNKTIADITYSYAWSALFDELKTHPNMVNSCRLPKDNSSPAKLYTPLHQAAHGKASIEVFQKLIELGASKTLKTAAGSTAYDIAKRRGLSEDILKLIEIPNEIVKMDSEIQKMEAGLHKTIIEITDNLIKNNGQQLPQLSFLYEFGEFWYPVPGMYGGFSVSKHAKGIQADSWCRVVGGSGKRHVIDRDGHVELTDEGFV